MFLSESEIEHLMNLSDDQFFQLTEIPDGYESEISEESDSKQNSTPNIQKLSPSVLKKT